MHRVAGLRRRPASATRSPARSVAPASRSPSRRHPASTGTPTRPPPASPAPTSRDRVASRPTQGAYASRSPSCSGSTSTTSAPCVVLPQGDFATFLPGQRRPSARTSCSSCSVPPLRRRSARLANRRAADANARIDALQGQLTGYADATAESEAAGPEPRGGAHRASRPRCATTSPPVGALLGDRTETSRQVERPGSELDAAGPVRVPGDIAAPATGLWRAADEAYRDRRPRRPRGRRRARPGRARTSPTARSEHRWTRRCAGTPNVTAPRPACPRSWRSTKSPPPAALAAEQAADAAAEELDRETALRTMISDGSSRSRARSAVTEVEQTVGVSAAVARPAGHRSSRRWRRIAARAAVDQASEELEDAEAAVVRQPPR